MSKPQPVGAPPPRIAGYPVVACSALLLALLGVALVNYIIDPYDLYPPVGKWSPAKQIDLFYHLRLHKPYAMQRAQARQLIAGSSRAARLPPARLGPSSYNASLPGATLREIRRVIEHAHSIQALESVVVSLDYYMFRQGHADRQDHYRDSRLLRIGGSGRETLRYAYQRIEDYWRSLLSVDALVDSWRTLYARETSQRRFLADGTWEAKLPPEKNARWFYGILARQKYAEFSSETAQLDMAELARLLAFCAQQDIPLTLLLSPMHGLTMNAVALAGQWPGYLDWQRQVVATATQSTGSVRVLGLEHIAGNTLEAIDASAPFFQDGVHFTSAGGELIMSCLAGACPEALPIMTLDNAVIDSYLSRVDALMRNYPESNSGDYALLLKWLSLAAENRPGN